MIASAASWPIIVVLRFSSMPLSISCFLINLVFHPMPIRQPQSNTYRYHIFYYFLQRPASSTERWLPRPLPLASIILVLAFVLCLSPSLVSCCWLFLIIFFFFFHFCIFKFTNIRNNSARAYRTFRKLSVICGPYCFLLTDNSRWSERAYAVDRNAAAVLDENNIRLINRNENTDNVWGPLCLRFQLCCWNEIWVVR